MPVAKNWNKRELTVTVHEIDVGLEADVFKVCLDEVGNLLIGCNFYLSRHQIYRMRKALGIL